MIEQLASLFGSGGQGRLGNYLPVTVTAAIAIFFTKEVLELRRRRGERARKIRAIKALLSQEFERNHWALVSMFRLLETLKESFEEYPDAVFRLHVTRRGDEHFRMKQDPEQDYESGQAIPLFQTELYEKLLISLAELDPKLYKIVSEVYEEIFDLAHYRNTITLFLAGEDLAPDAGLTRSFLRDFASEKDDYFSDLNKGYRALTGKDLKEWRLR